MKELIAIQSELKAPKGQTNSFGKYKYRSCEDILEAVKPLCIKHNCLLTISDEMIMLGERYYVKATAEIKTSDSTVTSVSAYAREALSKKGMDESQITGSASSYARKYALNGLFCIDDTKDADTMDNRSQAQHTSNKPQSTPATIQQKGKLKDFLAEFTKRSMTDAISYIAEALSNDKLSEKQAETILKHCKTKLETV